AVEQLRAITAVEERDVEHTVRRWHQEPAVGLQQPVADEVPDADHDPEDDERPDDLDEERLPGRTSRRGSEQRALELLLAGVGRAQVDGRHEWAPLSACETSPVSSANCASNRRSCERGYPNGTSKSPTIRPGRPDITITRVERKTAS